MTTGFMLIKDLLSVSYRVQAYVDYFCVASFGLTALLLRHTKIGHSILRSAILVRLAIGLACVVTALYVAQITTYVFYPNYSDHAEPTVANIGWLGLHGRPMYPDWVTDGIYGLLYGPILYLFNGLFLLAMPTLLMSKMPAIVSLFIAFGILFWVVSQRTKNSITALLILSVLVALFDRFGHFTYWIRAEPFLILTTTLALFAGTTLQPFVGAAVIGSLAGVAAGFKIHGFLYVLPVAMMLLARVKGFRDRAVLTALGTTGAAIFMLLPFCMRVSSLESYLLYLKLGAHHGLSLELLKENCIFSVAIIAPMAAIWYWQRPKLDVPERWFGWGLIFSIALVAIIAAKPGAGPHHLLPFAPLCLYGASVLVERSWADAPRSIAIVFIVFLAAYGTSLFVEIAQTWTYYRDANIERAKIVELRGLLDAYPDAQMGVSDGPHYRDTTYKYLFVLNGHPLRVDFVAWTDMQHAGVEESNILRFIKGCGVPEWILPLGPPFTVAADETQRPLLSDEFRRTFAENYQLVEMGKAYQVWACRPPK